MKVTFEGDVSYVLMEMRAFVKARKEVMAEKEEIMKIRVPMENPQDPQPLTKE